MVITVCLLMYTAIIVPLQICMWNYDDPCNMFPTLYFDVGIDMYFIVSIICHEQYLKTDDKVPNCLTRNTL